MKALNIKVMMAGLMMMSTACDKAVMSQAGDGTATVQTVSCKGETAPVDPSELKIEGSVIAQAGRAASFSLNHDLSCVSSQTVSWETSEGQILAQNNKGMVSSFATAGHYVVSAKVSSRGGAFAAKADSSVVQKTTVVGSSPMIAGPQAGTIGRTYNFQLALPEGYTVASAAWSFGDNTSSVQGLSAVSHAWMQPGQYTIKAVVTNSAGAQSVVETRMTIIDNFDGTECVVDAMINAPSEAYAGQPVDLSVYLPSCIADAVSGVSWSFGDNSPNGTNVSMQHTYASVGDYTISVNVYAPYVPAGTPFFTLTQTIHVVQAPPAPTPTPTPAPGASPTPVPGPNSCESAGAIRESNSASFDREVACGLDGKKKLTYQTRLIESCNVVSGSLNWVEVSRTDVLVSEGLCMGQSCTLPDGSKLGNGQSRTLYSTSTPADSCSSVSQTRMCNNGVLSGSSSYAQLTCRSGCGDFGKDGTVKTGVLTGEVKVALACSFGEEGYFDLYSQVSDKACSDGQINTSNARQGSLITKGSCPVYSWVSTNAWTMCTADCGGKQSLIYKCVDDKGADAPAARCSGAAPMQMRDCDGNPAAVRRVETSTAVENANSTEKCPANQIGVVLKERTNTRTKTYACISHSVQLESDVVSNGDWVSEKYCRDYVAYRCSQDSLSITEANNRYQWMLKCQDSVPVIKEFLAEFKDVKVNGGYSISSTSRPLYPTFMNTASKPEKPWIAPKSANASCEVPGSAYVSAVCLSSCATPDQEILAQAKTNMKMKYMPFIDALTSKASSVATMKPGSSMNSKAVLSTKVDQWVTEMLDTEHEIIEFRMDSGRVLKLTPNHPVLTSEGMMKAAADFKEGESLVMLGGALDPIRSISHTKHFGKVYNLFVASSELEKNVVVTNGYLNGTAYFQNEGASNMNRAIFRDRLVRGALK